MVNDSVTLAPLFRAVEQALELHRQELNLADSLNGNHGDYMVNIFHLASRAVEEKQGFPLTEEMQYAACLLAKEKQNGSAQEYSRGLSCMAEQFRKYEITSNDLVSYIQEVLVDDGDKFGNEGEIHQPRKSGEDFSQGSGEITARSTGELSAGRSAKVLKALVSGLAAWGQESNQRNQTGSPLDLGALFELGVAYLQAKQRGGSKVEVLADAAVSVSPLSKVPHRAISGKIAIRALLQAIRDSLIVSAG